MSSRPKKPVQLPFQENTNQTTTNTFGFESLPEDHPYVRAFRDTPTNVDPGVARRGDLREQAAENRWNSVFTSGLPPNLRMQMRAAEERNIKGLNASEAAQAEYARNLQEMAKRERLLQLPQLVQRGGTSTGTRSGFNAQADTRPGFWSSLAGGLASGAASLIPFI